MTKPWLNIDRDRYAFRARRSAFIRGLVQAEKDLASWIDTDWIWNSNFGYILKSWSGSTWASEAAAAWGAASPAPLLVFFQEYQVVSHHVRHVQVDNPVHQVEAYEAYGEHDAWILVYVGRRYAEQFVDVLQ